jgi:Na+/melibiose symporter-like transporter
MPYYLIFVYGSGDLLMIIQLGYYVWLLIAIPISFILSWFFGHLKVSIISGFVTGVALISLFFIADSLLLTILINIIGFTIGLGMASLIPLEGDVFDEFAKLKRKRSEGFAYGFLSMFGSLIVLFSSSLTTLVFNLIGYNPGWWPPSPSAEIGIKILMTLIPGIIIIIAMILFTTFYDLKPNKTETIRMELKELEI